MRELRQANGTLERAVGNACVSLLTSVVHRVLVLWFLGHFGRQGVHSQYFMELTKGSKSQSML